MPVTELVQLSLTTPDVNAIIGDPNHKASKTLNDVCSMLIDHGKALSVHFGSVIEEPSKLRLFINWQSLESHETFKSSQQYSQFQSQVGSLGMSGPPSIIHVAFEPADLIERALGPGMTRLVSFHFDGDVPSNDVEVLSQLLVDLDDVPADEAAWGTSFEIIEEAGVRGKILVLVMGLKAYNPHMQSRVFPEVIKAGAQLDRLSQVTVPQHISSMQFFCRDRTVS